MVHVKIPPKTARGIRRFSGFRCTGNICWSFFVTVHAKIPPKAAKGIKRFSRFRCIGNIRWSFCVMVHAKIPPKAARGIRWFAGSGGGVRGHTKVTSVMINSSISGLVFHDSPIRFYARVSDEIFGLFFKSSIFLGQNHTGLFGSVLGNLPSRHQDKN